VLASQFSEELVHYLLPVQLLRKDKHWVTWNQATDKREDADLKSDWLISPGDYEKSAFPTNLIVSKDTVSQILASLVTGRCTQHRACWQQVELSYLKGEKGFLATSWRGSLRGL